MNSKEISSSIYKQMILGGADQLKENVEKINNLNVFPIPDGDTGDNMLLTILGGVNTEIEDDLELGKAARKIADGMLLSARGNSGVILSQLFDGIAKGLNGIDTANILDFAYAMNQGVKQAYHSVLVPTEGTILTVARESAEVAGNKNCETLEEYLDEYLQEAEKSLERTPELLDVLKKAGVVDSGGAGLITIMRGMLHAINGEYIPKNELSSNKSNNKIDIDKFDENSVLEFGYCTECLLRLQNAKTDIENFNIDTITNFLTTIGDSVVAFKTGSVVKLHVHTMTPDKVLAFCQQYGEFLTIKIENMSLQHNSNEEVFEKKERKKYAVVSVCSGEGIQSMFYELGCDKVINGGQSMNPSTKDFLDAFDEVNADVIFVLPNNSNVILTANQAKSLYSDSEVIVINSKNIGQGHVALTMMNPELESTEEIEVVMNEAITNVTTACVSVCSRDTIVNGMNLIKGNYLGFVGDEILVSKETQKEAYLSLAEKLDFASHEICILIKGKDGSNEDTENLSDWISKNYPLCEVYAIDGNQDIYNQMIILE